MRISDGSSDVCSSDLAKLLLEKMNEFGLSQGKIPTVSFGIAIAEPDLLNTVSAEMVEGVIAVVANWGSKGHAAMIARLEERSEERRVGKWCVSTCRSQGAPYH